MILDTTFLIDVMNNDAEAVQRLQVLMQKGTPLTIATPSVFELFSGLSRSRHPVAELEKIKRVLDRQPRWALDEVSAERGGRIHGGLIFDGNDISAMDAMIAGIALEHHEPVLTRNVKHFSRVAGLGVEEY